MKRNLILLTILVILASCIGFAGDIVGSGERVNPGKPRRWGNENVQVQPYPMITATPGPYPLPTVILPTKIPTILPTPVPTENSYTVLYFQVKP